MTATERLAGLMARMEPEDGVLLRDILIRIAQLESFMDRVAKTLDCLPSYSDSRPEGGNAHIIAKLNGLVAEIELWRAGDITTANAAVEARRNAVASDGLLADELKEDKQ